MIENDLNPVWNHTDRLAVSVQEDQLPFLQALLKVYDEDVGSDSLLGQVSIRLEEAYHLKGQPLNKDILLMNEKGQPVSK